MSAPRKHNRSGVPSRQSQSYPPSSSHGQPDQATPPVVSRFRSAYLSQLPPKSASQDALPYPTGGKPTSHFGDLTKELWSIPTSTSSRDRKPERQKSTPQDEQQGSSATAASTATAGGVGWADLLAKIQQTRKNNYPSLPADYRYRAPDAEDQASSNAPLLRRNAQAESPVQRAAHIDERLHDRIFETQAESRRYSLALQEEIRDLQNPAEALNWLQDRLFDRSNDESLMSKIANTSGTSELHNLYADLLVDISNFLRTSKSPQSSFLPLILAKAHSPMSYLYGCTAKVYAVNVRAKWELYGDVQGVLELVQDMERGAVHLNPAIKDYIKNMSMALMADRMRAQKELDAEEEAVRLTQDHKKEEPESVITSQDEQAEPTNIEYTSAPKPRKALRFSSDSKTESRLFFTNSQHRALRELERLVVQDQERYFDAKAREHNLHDNIIARYGREAARTPLASSQDGNQSNEMENISEVNALIGSYGKGVRRYVPPRQMQSAPSQADSRTARDTRGSFTPSNAEGSRSRHEASMSDSSFDILNEAVSEASKEVQPKRRVEGGSNRGWKGKRSSKRAVGNKSAPAKQSVKKEVQPSVFIQNETNIFVKVA